MQKYDTVINTMINTILDAIQRCIKKAQFDKTVEGRIVSVLDDGIYDVEVNGETLSMPSSTDSTYTVNQAVWITFPQNSRTVRYISGKRTS